MSVNDSVEKIGASLIQHGTYNDRVYLMKLAEEDTPSIIEKLEQLCLDHGYSKIFAKIQASGVPHFLARGYRVEAYVPGFYRGEEDALFVCKYFSLDRTLIPVFQLTGLTGVFQGHGTTKTLPREMTVRPAQPEDAGAIAALYQQIFTHYPFPIFKPEYILHTMQEDAAYFVVSRAGIIIGAASAELDREQLNCEMTDFAVLPEYRGNSLGNHLLARMEKQVLKEGIKNAYTIARLNSRGMNKVFNQAGYRYSGTLINNTRIGEGIESMNVWYKSLESATFLE